MTDPGERAAMLLKGPLQPPERPVPFTRPGAYGGQRGGLGTGALAQRIQIIQYSASFL